MKAWLFQDVRQKQKLGDKCPWSVGWFEDGRKRSKKVGCQSLAEKFAEKLQNQVEAGTYKSDSRKRWAKFREEWEAKIGDGMEPQSKRCTLDALKHFERIIKPGRVQRIKTQTIDEYVSKRRLEKGQKAESTVSPATVNKELRHLRAVLRVAHEWGYLPTIPKVRMVKEPEKLIQYVTPEHFAAMYAACDAAERPGSEVYTPADWWRALLVFMYMTGWRISEPLALRWEDVSLDKAEAITWHEDNKGKRDERVPLHPIVVEHLRKLVDFGPVVFPWPHHERTLWVEFARIQQAAKNEAGERIINLPCHEKHEHTDSCHLYGFHDFRRAFASMNAQRLTGDALQSLMRHKSYLTTKKYINMARQLDGAVEQLHVPDFLKTT
ncbi:MAG: site-specific integrase [Thermoguttaceae bacterium]|jgi:integrase